MRVQALQAALLVGLVGLTSCAITDYNLITDNDQTRQGESGIVNTNGPALFGKVLVATVWPDGTDEFIHFVDQRPNGDRTLTTYNNFSTLAGPTFHDNLYCNPDWQGCAIFTADDPQTGDVDLFDGRENLNCDGARSLSMMLASSRYGECGRSSLSLTDRLTLLNAGRVERAGGVEALLYDLLPSNVTIRLDTWTGTEVELPLSGRASALYVPAGTPRLRLDLTNSMLSHVGRAYADFLESAASERTRATVTYHGISMTFDIAGRKGPSNPTRVLENVARHY